MEDPRCNKRNTVDHPLTEIMFLVVSAVVSGMTNWVEIQDFGKTKIDWLRRFFPYAKGIPWHGTLGRVFARLDSEAFGRYFIEWIDTLSPMTEGEVVAIDGKCMRGSYDSASGKSAIHMVSAYATQRKLCLGQLATEEKSNEITAIPKLLDLLTLEGATVTIDAMGCQKEIAQKILDRNADYILGVKDNQKGLSEQIKKVFDITAKDPIHTKHDLDHGRIEQRTCSVITNLQFLDDCKSWPGIVSLIRVEAQRAIKNSDKQESSIRYYISSKKASAEVFNAQIRSHWAVENNLHWTLDVEFREDDSRIRKGDSPENFSLMSKIALNLIERFRNHMPKPISINRIRNKAALSDDLREQILGI